MAQPIHILKDKHILLGISGSIASYKVIDLASKLTQAGAVVDVIMTESAQKFVTPLAFQSVTGRPVYTDMWNTPTSPDALPSHIAHVGLAEEVDAYIIAPATANTIAKLAHGITDNLLTITALAARCPIMIAPAMDGGMYEHPATQSNLETLAKRGIHIAQPESGRFASGLMGIGRLPETPTLLGYIRQLLGRDGVLVGRKIVVSAGGTREKIDPVRYIGNYSSGKQGYAIAQGSVDAGAREVILITTTDLPVPVGVTRVMVESAREMADAVRQHSASADALVMSAAVADFRPENYVDKKIKKSPNDDSAPEIKLTRNPDILLEVKSVREQGGFPRVVVGFAAETDNLLKNAREKLTRKGVDFLVANDVTASDAGFATDTNRVTILDADGNAHALDLMSKEEVAGAIIHRIAGMLV
jgi:phosphopantothenoylcysteine decarboxylase/phosphopantothenate--cysteine ligase